jgi:uncharacterized membrane protein
MKNEKTGYALMLLASTALGAAGQVLFKVAVGGGGTALAVAAGWLLLGLAAYGFSTLIYFYVLGRSHLSWAYGFSGLSFIFASLIAWGFLGESVPLLRWAGIGTIALGTLLIGLS